MKWQCCSKCSAYIATAAYPNYIAYDLCVANKNFWSSCELTSLAYLPRRKIFGKWSLWSNWLDYNKITNDIYAKSEILNPIIMELHDYIESNSPACQVYIWIAPSRAARVIEPRFVEVLADGTCVIQHSEEIIDCVKRIWNVFACRVPK